MNFQGKIGFIGGGNMARSLISGLIRQGLEPDRILVADPGAKTLSALESDFGIRVDHHNTTVAGQVELLVLAVKPQVMRAVCQELAGALATNRPLLISVAAGIPAGAIQSWLGGQTALVRCMPNTPAMIGAGASGLFATPETSPAQRQAAEQLLATAGLVVWVES
ncbi:MAG: NAD(P)-binding domain-containing protein, partial [Gammaproteobacteria bacterium]|nr:NAD(P)-binding domain-containing protein [Gammaproteobacteria bacterium]